MLYGIIGYLIIAAMMFLLLKGKVIPTVVFVTVPAIGALLAGFSPTELMGFIKAGIGTTSGNAVLFLFSVCYFSMMSEVKAFDPLINVLVRRAGNHVVLITVATSIVAFIAHLDGATATTFLVTIPTFLPIYKKMKMSPFTLLLITGYSYIAMNMVPWGGPTARMAVVLNMDVNDLWRMLIPYQIACVALAITVSVFVGLLAKKRGAGCDIAELQTSEHEKIPRKTWINIGVTVALLVSLFVFKFPSAPVFMIGFALALLINFKTTKDQEAILAKITPPAFTVASTMLGSGVFVGVINNTPMLEQMTQLLLNVIPSFMGKYLMFIMAPLSEILTMIFDADSFYYGIVPLVIGVGEKFSIAATEMSIAMMIGQQATNICVPMLGTVYLACNLAGVELGENIKRNYVPLFCYGLMMILLAFVMGVLHV